MIKAKLGRYLVQIEVEDRKEFGKYGKVYAKDPYIDRDFLYAGTLPPGVKLTEKLLVEMLMCK